MARMHEDPSPGERRLDRPPSDRYRPAPVRPGDSADGLEVGSVGSPIRGVAFGVTGAIATAVVIVVLGGVLAVSAGLLVAAAAGGYAIGLAVRAGSGPSLTAPARPSAATALAILAVLGGQLGLWLFARSEGGVLPLVDYLGQTFGALVPLQVVISAGVAWWTAR